MKTKVKQNDFNEQLKNKIFKCKYLDVLNKKGKSTVSMQLETIKEEIIQIEFDKYQLIDELSHIEYMKGLIFVKNLFNNNKSHDFEPDSIDISLVNNLMYIIKKGHRFDNDQEYIKALEDASEMLFDSIEY